MTRIVTLGVACAAATLAGCGVATSGGGADSGRADGGAASASDADGTGAADAPLLSPGPADGEYVATSVTGRRLVAGTEVRLTWLDGELRAVAGCNTLTGSVSVRDGRLRLEDLAMTELGCPTGRAEQDAWLAEFLGGEPLLAVTPAGFALTSAEASMELTDPPPPTDVPLEGTTWQLESTIRGGVTSSSTSGRGTGTPRFRITEGTVTGHDGCNDISGPVAVSGETLRTRLVSTLRGCSGDVADTARELQRLLGRSVLVIEGDLLTLHRGGTSMTFRPA